MFKFLTAITLLVAAVAAQSQSQSGSGSTLPNIQVLVGANGTLTYTPDSVVASPGQVVEFVFMAKNHSIRQTTFPTPCEREAGGFQAPFQPVAANATKFPTVSLLVNDTNPIWISCPQVGPPVHCFEGMVFAINPTPNKTIDQYRQNAINAGMAANGSSGSGSGSSGSNGNSGNSGVSPNTVNGADHLKLSVAVGLLGAVASTMLVL